MIDIQDDGTSRKLNTEELRARIAENALWQKIRKMSLDDEGLRNILESAIMYYQLRKPNG